jgi:hypothetical protein
LGAGATMNNGATFQGPGYINDFDGYLTISGITFGNGISKLNLWVPYQLVVSDITGTTGTWYQAS